MSLELLAPHEVGLTPLVKEQLERIYEETSYIVAGSLGRTASMGCEPPYWYRRHGMLRDIDVHDPYKQTTQQAHNAIHNMPLPIDTAGSRWIHADGDKVCVQFARNTAIYVNINSDYLEPIEALLLGVPVRTFRPEVLLGLNTAVPYNRFSQRRAIAGFANWVVSQPNYDPTILKPFLQLSNEIKTAHPAYVRTLLAKDIVSHLPEPMYIAVRSLYRAVKK